MTTNVITHGDSRLYIPNMQKKIQCYITDPPYGMNFASNSAQTEVGKKFTRKIASDGDLYEAIELFHSVSGPIIAKMDEEVDIYIFTAWHILEWWLPAVKELTFIQPDGTKADNRWVWSFEKNKEVLWDPKGFDNNIRLKQMLIWEKGDPGQGDLMANWGCGHEVILYLKKGRRPIPSRRSAVLHYDKVRTGTNIHPTEKPVPLLRLLIEMSTNPGDLVVDPFSGSGSTSVAAMETGRNSWGFELDDEYVRKSQERLETDTLFNA